MLVSSANKRTEYVTLQQYHLCIIRKTRSPVFIFRNAITNRFLIKKSFVVIDIIGIGPYLTGNN